MLCKWCVGIAHRIERDVLGWMSFASPKCLYSFLLVPRRCTMLEWCLASLSLSLIFPSLSAPCIMVMACVYNISPLYQSFALTLSRYKSRWRVSDWESATSRRATSFYTTQKEAQASCSDETLMNPHLYTQRVASFLVRQSLGFCSFLALPLSLIYAACFISQVLFPVVCVRTLLLLVLKESQNRCVAGRVSLSCTRESSLFAMMSYS